MELFLIVACALFAAVVFMQNSTIADLKKQVDMLKVFKEEKPVYVGLKPLKTAAKKPAAKKRARVGTK